VGLFEVGVADVENDGAVEDEEDVEFEFGAEGDGEPDGVGCVGGLGCVGDDEAEAGNAGAEEGADGEGNIAGHGGVDEDWLEGFGVDPGVTFPVVVILVAGHEGDVIAVATVHGAAADEGVGVVGLDLGGEGEEAGADAVFGMVCGEVGAHVFDDVEVHGVVVFANDFDVEVVIVFDIAGVGVELGVVEILSLVEEAAVEGEEFLVGAFVGGDDAEVSDLFAAGGIAFAREGVGVLNVDVMGAGGFGAILVGSDARHDVGGRGFLRASCNGEKRKKEEGCGKTHDQEYVARPKKFRGVWAGANNGSANWIGPVFREPS
jgi:hypothetical protein